jgi:hypothetical protein
MLIIWLEFPEISLKFEQSIQKLFDFNQVKIVMIKAVYYDKMYCIYSYHLKFCDKFHDCVAAASDFAIQIKEIKNELNTCLAGIKNFTRFEEFFGYFEFAMTEFEIAYFRMQCPQSVNKKSTGNLNKKDARNYVVEKYFSGKLLKKLL